MRTIFSFITAAFILMFSVSGVSAKYRYDTNLSKLWNSVSSSSQTENQAISTRNTLFRQLMSEMGVIFAPSFMAPAETLGYMGFALDLNYGITTISSGEDFWQNGIVGTPQGAVQTIGMQIRKGMWFPLPGFEIGGGVKYLLQSHMYAPHVFAKFSLNEGYFKWPIPALSVRGHGIRVMGSTDVDITLASVDVSISKSFGLNSTVNLTPYAGYNALMIVADSKVILALSPDSPTGYDDAVFDDQDTILRHRLFLGARLTYYKLVVTLEGVFTLPGDSEDVVDVYSSGQTLKIKDASKLQQSYTISLGWDW
ncbi:MAG: hypothetical protein JXR95_06500 [Deltaproteobacteria bacterium]|nr:hypothetical protein [Deltaproteobacteria bacterium]